MADGGFLTIVGADGNFMDANEARLEVVAQGIEDGTMATPEVYQIGATLARNLQLTRPTSPTLARFSRVVSNPATMSRLQNAMRPVMPNAPMAAPVAIPLQPQPSVQTTPVGAMREVVQGLDSGPVLIAAGASFDITFNATMLFEPSRLMIGPGVAPLFAVDDLRVSADSLFLSAGAVPGEVFLPDSVGASSLKRRTAQPGTPVLVRVTNLDGAAHRFRGAIFGMGADACR